MKVILLKDVPRLGRKYDIKEVPNGYGRNHLIPRGLAEVATEKAMQNIATIKTRQDEERKLQKDLLLKNLKNLNDISIVMQENANEQGHLFAGIHKNEIVPVLKGQAHLDISPEHIVLEHPIKELGEHKINVKIGDQKAAFTLVVERKP